MKVSIIGGGLIGSAFAERYLEKAYEVSVYSRSKSKTNKENVLSVSSNKLSKVIKKTNYIILTLTDSAAIKEVMLNESVKKDLNNKTIIQMGTILPSESIELSKIFKEMGASYLEAPFLGSIPQALDGSLIIMLGSTKQQYEDVKPVLSELGNEIHYIGEIGKAAGMKLTLNHLIASLTSAFSLSLGLVLKNDLDPELFMKILRDSSLYAKTFDKKLDKYLTRDFNNPNFPAKHMYKDTSLALKYAIQSGLNTKALEGVHTILKETTESDNADLDYSSLFNIINPK